MKIKKKLLAFLSLFLLLPITSCSTRHYEVTDYMLDLEYKEDFKVLQLSDIHLSYKDDRDRQYDLLRGIIEEANADLIVVTGDLFTFATKTVAKELFAFFDSTETYWTCTWGNHDEQCYFSIEWLTGYLNDLTESGTSYCKFIDLQDDDLHGNANFVINLKEGNNVKEQIIIMDSNRYAYDDSKYDIIYDDQINWYKEVCEYSKNTLDCHHNLLFAHIPVPELQIAKDLADEGSPEVEVIHEQISEMVSYEGPEDVSCPDVPEGLFEAVKLEGVTDGMFFGHDHINNYVLKYQGVVMGYGVNSSDRIYFDESLVGGAVYTIHSNNTYDIHHITDHFSNYR